MDKKIYKNDYAHEYYIKNKNKILNDYKNRSDVLKKLKDENNKEREHLINLEIEKINLKNQQINIIKKEIDEINKHIIEIEKNYKEKFKKIKNENKKKL